MIQENNNKLSSTLLNDLAKAERLLWGLCYLGSPARPMLLPVMTSPLILDTLHGLAFVTHIFSDALCAFEDGVHSPDNTHMKISVLAV